MPKTRKAKQIFRKVKAPRSWANGQFQVAGLPAPVRFDDQGEAWVLSKVDEDDITIQMATADGIEDVSILELIDREADFEVTRSTKTEEIEVAAE